MKKAPSGKDFKAFIDAVDPNRKELAKNMGISYAQLFVLFKADEVNWKMIRMAHDSLRNDYSYDLNQYFPDFEDANPPGVKEPDVKYSNNPAVESLRRHNDYLEKKVVDLTEKLNAAYEKIITGAFDKVLENLENNTALLKILIDKNVK